MSVVFVLSCVLALAAAAPAPQFPGMPPRPPGPPGGDLPPGFEAVLPKDVVAQLRAIHNDMTLSPLDKHMKIDQIMVNLPEEIHDRLPPPPGFNTLPAEVQQQLKSIHKDKSLDFHSRQRAIKSVLENLPADVQRLLPPPPPPPGFQQLPMPMQQAIKKIYFDTSLSHKERALKAMKLLRDFPQDNSKDRQF